ncbi:hypothetical protein Nepgr_012447 [Nepenthes gracilis]|uniref:Uncharacterized protein n=1 Tax=Nepenthes gracilis TaxID=150966 RepID=A0AAD3XNC1_NEPGR|nr:hypothetical protein Nepgr_012447 [Nepenthes gracilis]
MRWAHGLLLINEAPRQLSLVLLRSALLCWAGLIFQESWEWYSCWRCNSEKAALKTAGGLRLLIWMSSLMMQFFCAVPWRFAALWVIEPTPLVWLSGCAAILL